MKSITIHDLGEELDRHIREKARQDQTSLNKTIKNLLAQSLGLTKDETQMRRKEFLDLHGVWTESDQTEFEDAVSDFETIHEEDWK